MKTLKIIILSLFLAVWGLNAEVLKIDKAHSDVGFSIKHLMISNVKGKFTNYSANMDFDLDKKIFTKLEATVDASSIDTGIVKRDNHLRSPDFFDVKKYPDIKFVMTSYEKEDNSEGYIYGELTIHGVTKKLKLEAEINGVIKGFKGETRVGFTLTGKINRKDFGLNWNRVLELGGVAVGDKVKILIELQTIVK